MVNALRGFVRQWTRVVSEHRLNSPRRSRSRLHNTLALLVKVACGFTMPPNGPDLRPCATDQIENSRATISFQSYGHVAGNASSLSPVSFAGAKPTSSL